MNAAVPAPSEPPAPGSGPTQHRPLAPVVPLPVRSSTGRRLQALAALLVLPMALVATVLVLRLPAPAPPEIIVVGHSWGRDWAGARLARGDLAVIGMPGPDSVPATTEIVYRTPRDRDRALEVRALLGRGTLRVDEALYEGFAVTVYLGKDVPDP